MKSAIRWSLAIALVAAASSACTAESETPRSPLTLDECRPPGIDRPARCGTLTVAENPAEADGKEIALNIVVLPAKDGLSRPDAVLYLVGGPGLGATESTQFLATSLSELQQVRDIVLVDSRGCGRSSPLRCDMTPQESLDAMLAGRFERSTIKRCVEHLEADPVHYTSTVIAGDLDKVRSALGYELFDLVGISYGSRLALVYLRQFPDRVRTVSLRGVASPADDLLSDIGTASEQAMTRFFDRCGLDVACRTSYPDLDRSFRSALRQLDAEPLEVEVKAAEDTSVRLKVSRELFAGLVRFSLYSDRVAQTIPRLITEITASRVDTMRAMLGGMLRGGLASGISFGSYLSIVCSEDMPFSNFTSSATDGDGFFFTATVAGGLEAACSIWPHQPVQAQFKHPVTSKVPTLLMSGGADPATSEEAATRIASGLGDSRHLVTPGLAHMPTWTDCFSRNLALFIESGETTAIDEGCVDDYEPAGFSGSG